ncbi:hypothetical protein AHTJS_16425 [Acinetobacter haemolyticus]|nr:hypothetical protein AHTJS_16425 [Acinetobacter haemolyticus]
MLLISLSYTNPFGLYAVSDYTYILLILFLCFYIFGFLFANKKNKIKYDDFYARIKMSAEKLNNNKIFNILNALALVLCFYYTYKYISNFNIVADESVRSSRFEVGGVFSTIYDYLIFNYYVGSFLWFSKFIVAYGFVFGKNHIKKIFYTSLLMCLCSLLFGAGRNILVELVLIGLVVLVVKKSFLQEKNTSTSYLSKGLYVTLIFVVFVLVTHFRMLDESLSFSSFYKAVEISLEQIVVYVVGSFRALDYSVNSMHFERGYGVYTFASFNELYNMALRLLGFNTLPYSQYWGGLLAEQIMISDEIRFNALYTAVFNFYNDFGVFGVALFSFTFGWLSSKSVSYFLSNANILSLYILSIFFMSSFLSAMVFKLTPANIVFTLLVALLFTKYRFTVR